VALADTGGFSAETDDAGRFKTGNLVTGMGKLGYEVVSVTERDFAAGIAEFQAATGKSGLTFTSASFVYRDNGDQLLAPYAIKTYSLAGGRSLKIGYLGVDTANSAFAKEAPGGRVVFMRDPVEAVKLNLPALRPKVDFVVLLANLSLRDLTNLLSAAPGIDLALVSYGARISPGGQIETIAGVPVLYSGDQGKRMGEVRFKFAAKGAAPSMTANHVFLTRRYPTDPDLQQLIDTTIARVNEMNRAKATRLMAVSAGGAPGGAVPPSPATALPGHGPAGAVVIKPYLTATACASCHAAAFEAYQRSAHANALETLTRANQDYNPECVKCHVTGFDQPNGFVSARQTPELANVQCEACHGNGAEHVSNPQQPFGKVPPRNCFTCHTKENSPDFAFFKYWDKIRH